MDSEFAFFPKAASSIAGDVDRLYTFLWLLTLVFAILIGVLILYYSIKYRRASKVDRTKVPTSIWMEVFWIFAPLPILMLIFFWGADVFFAMYRPPDDTMDFTVVGKQWMWKFQHPTGQSEIDTLHVPVNEPIRLTMISQDVIHSLFIPAFRVKQDVLPGRYVSLWFQPTEVGEYHLFCAEYCGTNHAKMRGRVFVMSQDDYQEWLGGQASSEPPAVRGQKLFEQFRCASCHTGGEGARGPVLANLFGKPVQLKTGQTVQADDNYLRESIMRPQAKIVAGFEPIMPPYDAQLSEEAVLDLIAYIKSLSGEQPAAEKTK
jgi:cytochrome c oxidase subunit II